MLLSIIIPTLNESKYLPRLLDSLDRQEFRDYEIIVADAGSTDGTREIARERGCSVVAGGLPARGRNIGAASSRGEILLFLDADVVLPDGFLASAVGKFRQQHLALAGFDMVPLGGNAVDRAVYALLDAVARITGRQWPHAGIATMVRADAHRAVGGFDERAVFMEDFAYARQVGRRFPFGYLPIPFFVSMRRFAAYGRFFTYAKYVLGGWYVLALGPIHSNLFHYRFDGYRERGATAVLAVSSLFWQVVSFFGTPVWYLLVMAALLWHAGWEPWLARAVLAMALVEIICWSIKLVYRKDRPDKRPRSGFFSNLDANSFPSIHTARVSALGMLLAAGNPGMAALALAVGAAALVGYSRIALRRHFAMDVWAGAVIGSALGITALLAV